MSSCRKSKKIGFRFKFRIRIRTRFVLCWRRALCSTSAARVGTHLLIEAFACFHSFPHGGIKTLNGILQRPEKCTQIHIKQISYGFFKVAPFVFAQLWTPLAFAQAASSRLRKKHKMESIAKSKCKRIHSHQWHGGVLLPCLHSADWIQTLASTLITG